MQIRWVHVGRIVDQRTVWRWSVVSDFLWAIVGAWVFL